MAAQDSPELVCGLVHQVVGIKNGTCKLQRCVDGKGLYDEYGDVKWIPMGLLTVAGEPLGATPLHLACLFGCSGSVVAAVCERNPKACEVLDGYGRTPLAIAASVSIDS